MAKEKKTMMNTYSVIDLTQKVGGSLDGFLNLPPKPHSLQKIVITGATGWFGRHLVRTLLRQTQAQLFLLHRSPIKPDILWNTSQLQKESQEKNWTSRIQWLCVGNLQEARFPQMHFDTLIHSAADLSLAKDLESIWGSNTLSTQRLFSWALQNGCQHFHYISTLSVWVSSLFNEPLCLEEQSLEKSHQLFGGYASSKWCSESFLRLQMERFPMKISIHRLGLLTFSNEEGWHPHDPVWSTIEAWKKWGKPDFIPLHGLDLNTAFDWSPVCECAEKLTQAIILGGQGAFHWASQTPILAQTWFDLLNQYISPEQQCPWPKQHPTGKIAYRALDRWANPEHWKKRWWMDLCQTDRHHFSIQRAEKLVGSLWNPKLLLQMSYLQKLSIIV